MSSATKRPTSVVPPRRPRPLPPLVGRTASWLALVFAVLALGCSREVAVGSDFPRPVMEKIPARVGLVLDSTLRAHTHGEQLPGGGSWRVELGPANAVLCEQLIAGMFEGVVPLNQARAGAGVAVIFQPAIEQYQFSTPEQSKTDYYEAWIQYRLRIHSPDGRQVADWPFTGYGRSRARLLGAADSLDEATRRAMRDAAAVLVLELRQRPALQEILYGRAMADTATGVDYEE
jgi:hypothetical protein